MLTTSVSMAVKQLQTTHLHSQQLRPPHVAETCQKASITAALLLQQYKLSGRLVAGRIKRLLLDLSSGGVLNIERGAPVHR